MPITPKDIDNALKAAGANGLTAPPKPPLAHPSETICPDCGQKMRKAGTIKMGTGAKRRKVANFACENCGRRTVHPLPAKEIKGVT